VHRVAQRFKNRCNNTSITYIDLVQEGIIGLILAHDRYNPAVGTKFSTFANYWIEAKIRRLLDRHASTMHITYSASAMYNKLVKKYSSGRDGTTLDMIKAVQEDYASGSLEYRDYIRFISVLLAKSPEHYNHIPIDMSRANDMKGDIPVPADSLRLAEQTSHMSQKPSVEVELGLKNIVEKMLDRLDKDEQDIVIMYYGIGDTPPHTYERLAAKLKCSRQRIHQQHKKIIAKLRIFLKEIGTRDNISPREFLE